MNKINPITYTILILLTLLILMSHVNAVTYPFDNQDYSGIFYIHNATSITGDNITVDDLYGDINWSYIQNYPSFVLMTYLTSNYYNQSEINESQLIQDNKIISLNNSKLDKTDQRYNETILIDSINSSKYNKDEVYNKTESVDLFNFTNGTGINLVSKIFSLNTIYTNTLYYTKTLIDAMFGNYYNSSVVDSKITSLNNSKLDKTDNRYNETDKINAVNTSLNTEITNRVNNDTYIDNRVTSLNNTKLDKTDQRYNDTLKIDSVNISLNTEITNRINNDTAIDNRVTSINNSKYDKDEVYNQSEIDAKDYANNTYVNTKANPGNCASGYAVQNTTSSGVECVLIGSSSGTVTNVTATLPLVSTHGTTPDISLDSCPDTEILAYNSSYGGWQCQPKMSGGGGTVTSVGSGTGLQGGPITSSGTLSINTTYTDNRYYTQTVIDTTLEDYYTKSETYNNTEIDNKDLVLDNKIDSIGNWSSDKDNYYNKTEVNDKDIILDNRITSLNNSKLDKTDQRYNETSSINNINSSLQTEITNRINNDTYLNNKIDSIGNWTNDKSNYYNKTESVDLFNYTNGTGINLVGTIFSFNTLWGDLRYYTQTAVDNLLDNYYLKTYLYNKTEIDEKDTVLDDKIDSIGNWSADKDNYYNKTENNDLLDNKLNITDQRYNETSLVNSVNTSLNTEITNRVNNDTYLDNKIDGLGNWSSDKDYYYNSTEIDAQQLAQNNTISSINTTLDTKINAVNTTSNIKGLGFNTTTELDNKYLLQTEEGNLNVNSSDYWDGLNTPADINTGDITDDGTYVKISGDTMTGPLNMSNNPIHIDGITLKPLDEKNENIAGPAYGVYMTGPSGQNLPHLIVQSGGASQASVIMRSLMVVNEIAGFHNSTDATDCMAYMNEIGEMLKIDCNTTTTGADLLVGDDMQIVGDVWIKDDNGEWHFMSKELNTLDSMMAGTIQGNLGFEHNDTSFSVSNLNGKPLVINIDGFNYFEANSTSISLTSGTDSVPVANYLTFQKSGSNAVLTNDAAYPSGISHSDIALIVKGSPGNIYLHLEMPTATKKFIYEVYDQATNGFEKYISGFSPDATATNLNFTSGKYWTVLTEFDSENSLNVNIDGFFIVKNDGTFEECSDFTCITNFNDGAAIPSNDYVNVIWAVIPDSDNTSRLVAIPSNEPSNDYNLLSEAQQDKYNVITYTINNPELTKHKMVLVRTIIDTADYTLQDIGNGILYQSILGLSPAGTSAGGTNDHSLLSNLDYVSSGHTGFQATINQALETTSSPTFAAITSTNNITLNGDTISDWSDVNISYTAGSNLTLIGTEFSLDTTSVLTWLDNVYVKLTDIVGLVGNWSADKPNYYNKTEIDNKDFINETYANNTYILQTEEGNLNVNHSDTSTLAEDSTAWITMTSLQSKWFSDSTNILTFNETELNNSIESYGYTTNLGTVTAVTGSSPITSTGGTTPDIGLTLAKDIVTTSPITGGQNNVLPGADADLTIAIPKADTSTDGYLSQTDWDTFNNKADTDTTYSASGTLLDLSGTTFSVNEGTLTDTKYCTYESGTGIVCNSEGGSAGFSTDQNAELNTTGSPTFVNVNITGNITLGSFSITYNATDLIIG